MNIAAIGAMSMEMSLNKVQQGVNVAMAKNAMNLQETQAGQMLDMLNSIPSPASFGHKLDVYV